MAADRSGKEGRNGRDGFRETVGQKAARRERARREGDRWFWFGLGMMGLVGWAVTLPTIAGIALGIWLDHHYATTRASWALTGLVVGVVLGCLNAWYWVRRHMGGA